MRISWKDILPFSLNPKYHTKSCLHPLKKCKSLSTWILNSWRNTRGNSTVCDITSSDSQQGIYIYIYYAKWALCVRNISGFSSCSPLIRKVIYHPGSISIAIFYKAITDPAPKARIRWFVIEKMYPWNRRLCFYNGRMPDWMWIRTTQRMSNWSIRYMFFYLRVRWELHVFWGFFLS